VLGAGLTPTALYEIVPVGLAEAGMDPLRYQSPPLRTMDPGGGELLTVKLRYKEPGAESSQLLSVPFTDEGLAFEQAGGDFRFATAVAAFGLCLRDSELRGKATLADVFRWAEAGIVDDPYGDAREFLRLVDVAAGLSGR
jgi:Ca-activated chloride channel family protein